MSLEATVMTELKAAMKAKDQAALRSIRAIKAEIMKFKTNGSGDEFTDAVGIKILQKMVKQRQESLDIFVKQGREDLAAKEREEMEVIKKFLPEQMSEEKVKEIVADIVAKTDASSMKDMGKVMGMASKELAGKADGKTISAIVKQLLG